jgi:YegS/Rv2252/BmrU family lipid kinase
MNHWLLINEKAGAASTRRSWLLDQAERADLTVHEVQLTNLTQLLGQARQQGVTRLVLAGGDGTIAGCAQAMAPDFDRFELGIIPLGTGNDFARSLGIATDDVDESFYQAVHGVARSIDLLQVSDQETTYCLNVTTGGAGGEITANMSDAEKQRWGSFAYWLRAIAQFVDLHSHKLTLVADDEVIFDGDAYGIIVTNGRFVGGGFPIAPTARMDDGRFDVTVIPLLPRWDLISAGLFYAMGQTALAPQIVTKTAQQLTVHAEPEMMFSLDGEPSVHLDARFEILPRALRIVPGKLLVDP